MKIADLMEKQEFIPRSTQVKADKLAKQLVDLAITEFGKGDENYDATGSALQMAKNFHKLLVDHIKDHAKFRAMKKLQPVRRGQRVDDYV